MKHVKLNILQNITNLGVTWQLLQHDGQQIYDRGINRLLVVCDEKGLHAYPF